MRLKRLALFFFRMNEKEAPLADDPDAMLRRNGQVFL